MTVSDVAFYGLELWHGKANRMKVGNSSEVHHEEFLTIMSIEQTCVVDSFAISDDYFTYVVLCNLQVIGHDDAITIPPSNYHIILGLRILCQKVNKRYVRKFHFSCVCFFLIILQSLGSD